LRETVDTPDVLKAAGLDYVCVWVVDDVPNWMTTSAGPLLSMPYNIEINDSIIYAIERHATGEMLKRLAFTLEQFEQESHDTVRVLAIGLHPHLIAVPHRIHEMAGMLDLLMASKNTIFTTGADICDWYRQACPSETSPAR
jgi:hypothetical protein